MFPGPTGERDPDYAQGGNPGGHIVWTDGADEDVNDFSGYFMTFISPVDNSSPWVGSHAENDGGTFSFHLRTDTTATRGPQVQLDSIGGHGSLVTDFLAAPAVNTWTSYAVSLDATDGELFHCKDDVCDPATQEEILTVLSHLFRVGIVGDTSSGTSERVGIDNAALSGGSSPPDADGDGIPDAIDECADDAGSIISGCPVERTLALAYRKKTKTYAGALGAVRSGYAEEPCLDSRTVEVFRKKRGRDKLVLTTTTLEDGTFDVQQAARPGKYYAVADAEVLTVRGEPHGCAATRSKTITVR